MKVLNYEILFEILVTFVCYTLQKGVSFVPVSKNFAYLWRTVILMINENSLYLLSCSTYNWNIKAGKIACFSGVAW